MGGSLSRDDDTAPIPVVVEPPRARHAAPPPHHGAGWWALRIARETAIVLAIALLASIVIRLVLAQPMYVPDAAMSNTLQPGDRVLVAKGLSAVTGRSRGDVVAFADPGGWSQVEVPSAGIGDRMLAFLGLAPATSGDALVMRVIAVGGDRIECCNADGRIVLNGVPLAESYLPPGMPTDQVTFEVTVPQDAVFVMGDDRVNARDSRYHLDTDSGAVPTSRLLGRAVLVLWPLGHLQALTTPAEFSDVPEPTASP